MDFRRRSPALFRGGAVMRDKAPRRRALQRQGQTEIARYMRQFALKSGPGAGRGRYSENDQSNTITQSRPARVVTMAIVVTLMPMVNERPNTRFGLIRVTVSLDI